MAFDFPSSPTTGQQFSPTAGTTYVYNGYAWNLLSGPQSALAPTKVTVLTSGSGTYSVTPGTMFMEVELVGGGGGGASSALGNPGTATTFGTLTGNGGAGGVAAGSTAAGGTATGGQINLTGANGAAGSSSVAGTIQGTGGSGGNSYFGGAGVGSYGATGSNASPNTGSGGSSGPPNANTTAASATGGGAGGYCRALITSPAGSYAYTVGAAGTGAGGNANYYNAANGAAGIIIVTEYGGSSAAPVTVPVIKAIGVSGTYTPSPGLVAAIVEVVGGGGGGGSATSTATTTAQGGGGGAGAYSRRVLTAAQIGASQTITIGAGGGGGNGGPGSAGGTTSFGSLVTAGGGGGGGWSNAGVGTPAGGVGGVVGTGDFSVIGNAGGWGLYGNATNQQIALAGNGGAGIFGGSPCASLGLGGANGQGMGAGGAGASSHAGGGPTQTGGAGTQGYVIITEFIQQGGAAAAALPGSKVLIQTQTVSSAVASVNFTSGIDATYDEYILDIYNGRFSAVAGPMLQVSFDAGATWKTDAIYAYGYYAVGSGGTPAPVQISTATAIVLSSLDAPTAANFGAFSGSINFQRPFETSFHIFRFDTVIHSTGGGFVRIMGDGGYTGTGSQTPLTGIRIIANTGNIAGGTFNLYGIKK